MLTRVDVLSPGILTPPFPIVGGAISSDPFRIRSITGLDPVKSSINTTQYGSIDGEFFNNSYTGKRNIVLTVGLNPDWVNNTIESLRQILYTYFMPENSVTLQFTSTHMEQVQIDGYVESMEQNMFSQDPEMQISIICPLPYFTAVAGTSLSGVTTAFSDPSVVSITNPANINAGFVMDVAVASGGPTLNGEFRIVNTKVGIKVYSIIAQIDTNNYLEISTVQGNKYAKQLSTIGLDPINIMGKVNPGSIWIAIEKGLNQFQFQSANPGQTWAIKYYARYGGL